MTGPGDTYSVDAGSVRATLTRADCLEWLPTLPDASVDLVLTDPPYYRVKGADWDRQWRTPTAFLDWLGEVLDEFRRVLKPNGSLYLFASPQMAARVEISVGERFEVLNSIRWVKAEGWHKKADPASLRSFLTPWEACIFAEQSGADSMALGESGYEAECERLRGFVFEPLRAYLDGERKRAGIDKADCNAACGFSRTPGGMASRHYFSRSQWQLPTAEHYASLQRLFNGGSGGEFLRTDYEALRTDYEFLRTDYEALRTDYEALRADYEALRRPFDATRGPSSDLWNFSTVVPFPGKHECEKPREMIRHIINASSRPGAVVLDAFAGSGVVGEMALHLNRQFIGCEKDEHWFRYASERLASAGDLPLFVDVPKETAPAPLLSLFEATL